MLPACGLVLEPFTDATASAYGVARDSYSKVQVYINGGISLRRVLESGEQGVEGGTLRTVGDQLIEEIFLRHATPGVVTKVGDDWLAVSFESGRELLFTNDHGLTVTGRVPVKHKAEMIRRMRAIGNDEWLVKKSARRMSRKEHVYSGIYILKGPWNSDPSGRSRRRTTSMTIDYAGNKYQVPGTHSDMAYLAVDPGSLSRITKTQRVMRGVRVE